MADDKVYYPEEIQAVPLPGQSVINDSPANAPSSGQQTYSPATSQDAGTPKPRIARETVSSSINTKSRKILDTFEFTQMGALQIGNHELGVSGDVRISPNGMLARNLAGQQTILIDGDTGDISLIGTLRAGSIFGVNGNFAVEESEEGNARIVLYTNGLPSIVIGDPT